MSRTHTLIASLLLLFASASTAAAQTPVGTWYVDINTGDQNRAAVVTLAESGGALSGTIAEPGGGSMALQNIRFASDTLTFAFVTYDYGPLSVRLVVNGNEANGFLDTSDYGSFPMKGTRKDAPGADLVDVSALPGTWRITGEVAGYPLNEVCSVDLDGTALSGSCTNGEGNTYDVSGELKDGKVTLQHGGDYQGTPLTIVYKGSFASPEQVKGSVDVQPFGATGSFTAAPANE